MIHGIAERTNALMTEYQQNGENFFLWASFFDPHPKYLVPEPWDTMYDPAALTVPAVTEGEHENNPPHFQLTQQQKPDFSEWRETGKGVHGFRSHLRNRDALAKDIAVYYGMVSLMDKYIGRILGKLDELGLADNTLVVFTSDHGHFYGQHGLIAKGRVPLRRRNSGAVHRSLSGRCTLRERNRKRCKVSSTLPLRFSVHPGLIFHVR